MKSVERARASEVVPVAELARVPFVPARCLVAELARVPFLLATPPEVWRLPLRPRVTPRRKSGDFRYVRA